MSFRIDDKKLLEKYKAIWIKSEYLKKYWIRCLPVDDAIYIKMKIKTYSDNVHTNFCGLNVAEHGIEFGSFAVISIDSLPVYDVKSYLQVEVT